MRTTASTATSLPTIALQRNLSEYLHMSEIALKCSAHHLFFRASFAYIH